MSRKTPLQTALVFVKLYAGRTIFGAFNGQDLAAWSAFVYLMELWVRSDDEGKMRAVQAMKSTLEAAQREHKIHYAFILTIPAIGDWGHAEEIWPALNGLDSPLMALRQDAKQGPSR